MTRLIIAFCSSRMGLNQTHSRYRCCVEPCPECVVPGLQVDLKCLGSADNDGRSWTVQRYGCLGAVLTGTLFILFLQFNQVLTASFLWCSSYIRST